MPRRKNKNVSLIISRPNTVTEIDTNGSSALVVPGGRQGSRKRNRNRRRRRNRGGGKTLSLPGPVSVSYFKTLADPFDNPGVKLGWGTLVPTSTQTAYVRGSLTANADGTLAIVALPSATSLVTYNNSGNSGVTWTSVNASDQAAITSNYSDGRPVSLALRAFPSTAATSVPGVVEVGAFPMITPNQLIACSPSDFFSFPTTQVFKGSNGGSVTGRPIDSSSFVFLEPTVNATGFTGTNDFNFSIPYIMFAGLPASSVVYYEAVLRFEGIAKVLHNTAPLSSDSSFNEKTLSDEWPSVERMWSMFKTILPTPGQATEAAASLWNAVNAYPSTMRTMNNRSRQNRLTLTSLADSFLAFE